MSVWVRSVFSLVLLVAVVLSFWGCAAREISYEALYWPPPPDKPRYVYEGTLRTAGDLSSYKTVSKVRDALTGLGVGNTQAFAKPYDLAARRGRLVVSDTVAKSLLMWDMPGRKMYHFGLRGDGMVKKPLGVGMDANRRVYVADVGDSSVKVYDELGLFIKYVGESGQFQRPVDVAVNEDGDRIYVVDAGGIGSRQHSIHIFDDDGDKVATVGERGSGFGQFNLPIQAAVSPDGLLYVLDAGNFRVQVFDEDGEFVRSFGKVGRNFGNLARPRGIAIDQQGNVYVSDAAYRNFQVFNPDGKLLMSIGARQYANKPGHFSLPAGIAIDETNHVYIVDQILVKVDIFRKLEPAEIARAVVVDKRWRVPKLVPQPPMKAPASAQETDQDQGDF